MKAVPKFWIDSFDKKDNFWVACNKYYEVKLFRGKYYTHEALSIIIDGGFDTKEQAIQAAWEHFISQPEVKGLISEILNDSSLKYKTPNQ